MIKTGSERYRDLAQRVRQLHLYSVPEVLALPIETGSADYLRWVHDSVAVEGR